MCAICIDASCGRGWSHVLLALFQLLVSGAFAVRKTDEQSDAFVVRQTFEHRTQLSIKSEPTLNVGGPLRRVRFTECAFQAPACSQAFGPDWQEHYPAVNIGVCGDIFHWRQQCRRTVDSDKAVTAEKQEGWCPSDSGIFRSKVDLVQDFLKNWEANAKMFHMLHHHTEQGEYAEIIGGRAAEHIMTAIEHHHENFVTTSTWSFSKIIPIIAKNMANVAMQVQQSQLDAAFTAVTWAGTLNRAVKTFFWKERSLPSQKMKNYLSLPSDKLDFMMYHNKVPELAAEIGDAYIAKMSYDDWLCSPLLERNADHMWETSIPANSRVYLAEEGTKFRAIFQSKQRFGDESRSIHEAVQHLADAIDSNREPVVQCKSLWSLIQRVNEAVGSLILAGRNFCVPGLHKTEAFGRKKWQWFSDCLEAERKFWAAIKAHEDVEQDYSCGFSFINYQDLTIAGAGTVFSRPWLLGAAEALKHWKAFTHYIRSWHQKASSLVAKLVSTISAHGANNGRVHGEVQQHFMRLATDAYSAGRSKALETGRCSDCTASLGLVDCEYVAS